MPGDKPDTPRCAGTGMLVTGSSGERTATAGQEGFGGHQVVFNRADPSRVSPGAEMLEAADELFEECGRLGFEPEVVAGDGMPERQESGV